MSAIECEECHGRGWRLVAVRPFFAMREARALEPLPILSRRTFCIACMGRGFLDAGESEPSVYLAECPACEGAGEDDFARCWYCNGTGTEWVQTFPIEQEDLEEAEADPLFWPALFAAAG
jgi:DnaJ-class molecular chaperone